MPLETEPITPLAIERFTEVLPPDGFAAFSAAAARAATLLDERVVFNVNSTARGGGVAEMLRSLIAYARGAGIDARWLVIPGDSDFFTVTKRIHNRLHGAVGDGGALGGAERRMYEATLAPSAAELGAVVTARDIVVLHDPQTAGLIVPVKATGAAVIWRCHVGLDHPNDHAREAWRFLLPYVTEADAIVFSRSAFRWTGLESERVVVIPPSIDAFSPKNQDLDPSAVDGILRVSGLVDGAPEGDPVYARNDGRPDLVEGRAEFRGGGPPPPHGAPTVVQVSRWDRLKDPAGVITGFAQGVATRRDAHLIVAGPSVAAVADDPEGAEVLDEAYALWASLPGEVQGRIHLATLPMDDGDENAAIVNALQRHATVIVQKSIAEGFGLTVSEGMWKGRPVVASAIGGIQDQIEDEKTGLLLNDPFDLNAYSKAVTRCLQDREWAEELGRRARERVRDAFLGPRHLMQYVDLFADLLGAEP